MQPIAAAAHAEVADTALDTRIDGRDIHCVAAASAARAVGGDAIGVNVIAGLHVLDGVANIFAFPLGHHPAALFALAVAPAAIIEAKTGVARRAKLVEHHDVMLGVFEAEKAGTLDNSRKRFVLIRVRQIKIADQLVAFAVKRNFFSAHFNPQKFLVSGSWFLVNSKLETRNSQPSFRREPQAELPDPISRSADTSRHSGNADRRRYD